MARPTLFSGVQPTGSLTIANYVGALRNWTLRQESHEAFFMLADLHAITVRQEPEELRRRSLEFAALILACGVDPAKSTVFLQSQVPAHGQLLWVLNCFATMGELERMTQFKEKARRRAGSLDVGLFDYPVLMAADILLYDTDRVPVGEDQRQHLEFTRALARRFNSVYGEVFRVPKISLPETGARLKGLRDPLAKMSKSDENPDNFIGLLDPPDAVARKVRSAVTDSGREIRCGSLKEGVCGLMTLFSAVSGESMQSLEQRYAGRGYAELKRDLAEAVIELLGPIQQRYHEIIAGKKALEELLRKGAGAARRRAAGVLARVHGAVGFLEPGSRPKNEDERRRDMEYYEIEGSNYVPPEEPPEEASAECCDCCCGSDEEECLIEE